MDPIEDVKCSKKKWENKARDDIDPLASSRESREPFTDEIRVGNHRDWDLPFLWKREVGRVHQLFDVIRLNS